MDFYFTLKGRDICPTVVNLKQYSAGDRLIFKVVGDMPKENVYVIGDTYKQKCQIEDDTITWTVDKTFTENWGSLYLQLKDDSNWYSDVFTAIVSESLKGDTPIAQEEKLTGIPCCFGIFVEPIVGEAVVIE